MSVGGSGCILMALTFGLTVFAPNAQADDLQNTLDRVEECRLTSVIEAENLDDLEHLKAIRCLGWLEGYTTATDNYDNWLSRTLESEHPLRPYCLPKASMGRLAQVFVTYAEANPRFWDWPADKTLHMAFLETYPCSNELE